MNDFDIIIIGAGMSGLTAASEIYKVNRNIMVLEARNRIGGRLSSERLPDGLLFERGGGMIHGTNNMMYDLVNELGFEIRELNKEEGHLKVVEGGQLLLFMLLLRMGVHPKPRIDESVTEYVNRISLIPNSLNSFMDSLSRDFETFDRVSALHMVQLMRQQLLEGEMYGDRDFVLVEGYIQLLNHLAQDLPIKFEHEVRAIRWHEQKTIVETDQGAFQANKVVLTLPIPILKKMTFDPELPEGKKHALSAHVTGDIIKLLIPIQKTAFKAETDEGQIPDAKFVPMWWRRGLSDDKPEDRQMLIGWITGPYARRYLNQPPEEALEKTLKELEAVVDTAFINRDDIIVQNWTQDPYSAGTYCYIKPGFGLQVIDNLAASLENKLYFAGTATAERSVRGTAHAAYESGLRVAKEVLA